MVLNLFYGQLTEGIFGHKIKLRILKIEYGAVKVSTGVLQLEKLSGAKR